MKIRKAEITDLDQIRWLFYGTIVGVNAKDYTPEQITTWAAGADNIDNWKRKINEQYFFVSETGNIITGFCSMEKDGYIDLMYVHKDFQGQSIASKLLAELEKLAHGLNLKELTSDVSITAQPFFENKGFLTIKQHLKYINNIEFVNIKMSKIL